MCLPHSVNKKDTQKYKQNEFLQTIRTFQYLGAINGPIIFADMGVCLCLTNYSIYGRRWPCAVHRFLNARTAMDEAIEEANNISQNRNTSTQRNAVETQQQIQTNSRHPITYQRSQEHPAQTIYYNRLSANSPLTTSVTQTANTRNAANTRSATNLSSNELLRRRFIAPLTESIRRVSSVVVATKPISAIIQYLR